MRWNCINIHCVPERKKCEAKIFISVSVIEKFELMLHEVMTKKKKEKFKDYQKG